MLAKRAPGERSLSEMWQVQSTGNFEAGSAGRGRERNPPRRGEAAKEGDDATEAKSYLAMAVACFGVIKHLLVLQQVGQEVGTRRRQSPNRGEAVLLHNGTRFTRGPCERISFRQISSYASSNFATCLFGSTTSTLARRGFGECSRVVSNVGGWEYTCDLYLRSSWSL